MKVQDYIQSRTKLAGKSIQNTISLLEADATIPFISRYRKEATGNLDETEIEKISQLLSTFKELETRKNAILKSIKEQEALTEALADKINKATTLAEVEDLYLPYKKKRKTKADTAREAGLEPLAKMLMAQNSPNIERSAQQFISGTIKSKSEAFVGAGHIIAEWINENTYVRNSLRRLYTQKALLSTKWVKKEEEHLEAPKFTQFEKWEEPLKRIPSHRFLAIYRAEKLGIIKLKVEVDKFDALAIIEKAVIKNKGFSGVKYLKNAAEDAFTRLLKKSFATEFLNDAKEKADEDAIAVFASNLEQLLMEAPLGSKRILAIDPGFRSGCKIVCLDEQGNLLYNEAIFPHPPQKKIDAASAKIKSLVNAYKIQAIAIGNGTAARETEQFIKNVYLPKEVLVFTVNEAGASVYSASKIAREEFPNYDVTVRGAVSIGRRLSDPLAELVKIDPKAIGVGQYQHEVDQTKLKEKLDVVVKRCVNKIGVNLNTASKELLSYVSGIGPGLAQNILDYRKENKRFTSRKELLKVPRLGEKAFEQSAGFLRIKNAKNPLDNSAVHPESYFVVEKMAKNNALKPEELIGNTEVLEKIKPEDYISENIGLLSLKDILGELKKPGADPRAKKKAFSFDPSIKTIADLKPGMKLPGIVNNITNFGCFVDIGIKESGLIHISKLANEFISDVNSVVKLNQELEVTVLSVDEEKKRVQLSLID
ncbi:Tex family protein [Salegentibacter maritimus]|uniref:RNA-binding transcriptional accessory protein n=1 Tax=Salegentibacter maritimus TaxID=2794347 RepID=A0ABS0THK2_9FLAO|nr:Tex family protein [Salegentibacter maritimus]MBI6120545.1 RNA-binding transcriptional accessory protein [Salegentibacter maritimus]